MSFILGDQRDRGVAAAFREYAAYLRDNAQRFPAAAYALATSDWYFDPHDHRCPHDAWLEIAMFTEPSTGSRSEKRTTSLTIRLLSAYHDGEIEFTYPEVYSYQFEVPYAGQGHGDWRYDEFRVDDDGHLIHEIEWAVFGGRGRWLIAASDVHHRWIPKSAPAQIQTDSI